MPLMAGRSQEEVNNGSWRLLCAGAKVRMRFPGLPERCCMVLLNREEGTRDEGKVSKMSGKARGHRTMVGEGTRSDRCLKQQEDGANRTSL